MNYLKTKQLKSFIHLYRFYMEHVQSFAEIASLLTNLLKKDSKFILGPKEIIAWNLLKAQTLKATKWHSLIVFFMTR